MQVQDRQSHRSSGCRADALVCLGLSVKAGNDMHWIPQNWFQKNIFEQTGYSPVLPGEEIDTDFLWQSVRGLFYKPLCGFLAVPGRRISGYQRMSGSE